ncbi:MULTISPECIES: DUF3226 domain-containing protein [Butyricimonas]|jgi:hypothetical protein|uniref:DUF4276 family protein n=1 Tax=Butyricimonas virosa TaxID=544645 RepID=A0ABX7H7Y7_9BACT|nr:MULTISPECIES: DUF3226 domain-containing protein [Butyricimonas]MBS5627165.1 hypothetical protein [Porphyromonadaceae bacterium]MBO4957806.1 hypothetical protein [Butyricimonas sp.]MDY5490645.1 DUF3226 domain-containing protein [Butyricimonas virosa]QRO51060.1 hypothetical protein I6J59_05435 [Butyricimonas virosa]UWO48206.1 hypothetical protein NQ494_03360 [Butyricimonas virosa]
MTKIFIEAKNNKTSEYHFLQTIINIFFPKMDVEFIFMDGIGNLYNETILNQIKLAQEIGEQVIVFADADTEDKGIGYEKRKKEIENGMTTHNVSFHYFLYPNNQNDGDVEKLMENAARRDLHSTFFDCFEDYERCVSGSKDESGEPKYNVPNLKGKLHTYMAAQKLPRKLCKRFGSGDWLFDNPHYWNLNVDTLQPLKEFFAANLK